MPRKKIKRENHIVMDAAVGISAWALVIELLVVLERRDVLKPKDTLRVITGATAAIEMLAAETAWHPGFAIAIEMLKEQAAHWRSSRG
ncbi:hypothetical protein [Reyranella soli]|uniref:Uncharacterized protein n=1 Tax=Reyranella soli TaxID=1230389 RepID=A0A512NKP0_9HYPH|nr:hypothetical protein [Reyranella soli]GEP59496.1 hypothetical protein RSO01_66620 [Reyranella soli]